MPWKVVIFHIQNAIKNNVYEVNYLKLGTYVLSEALLVYIFRCFEHFEIWEIFLQK